MDRIYLQVTEGNLRQNHLYVKGHLDFFLPDIDGPPRKSGDRSHEIALHLDGLNQTIYTDIGRDASTNEPRSFLRDRGSIGKDVTSLVECRSRHFHTLGPPFTAGYARVETP